MTAASRRKGASGEREAAALLRHIWPRARRGFQTRDGADQPDVDGTPWWVEVKRAKRIQWVAALRQALHAISRGKDRRPPLVVGREDGGEWLVMLRLDDFLALYHGGDDREEALLSRIRRAVETLTAGEAAE